MSNPTTLVSAFNSSLAYTDQSGASAWTGVDPVRYSSGLWVEEGTTNLHTKNVGYEDSIASWTDFGTSAGVVATWSQSNEWSKSGTYSIKMTGTADDVNDQTARACSEVSGITAGEVYAFSGSYNRQTSTLWIQVGLQWRNSGANVGAEVKIAETLSGVAIGVVDFSSVQTAPGTANGYRLVWRVRFGAVPATHTFYGDNIDVEHKGYATSYTDGSLGTGYAWTSTAFASTSTRAASSASVATASHIDPATGSLAFRFTRKIDTGGTETILECGTAGSGTDYLSIYVNSSDKLVVSWNSDNAGAQTVTSTGSIAVDTEYFVYTDWSGTDINLRIGTATDTDTRDAAQGDWGAGALKLEASAGGAIFNGIAVYDRSLTTTEQNELNGSQSWGFLSVLPRNRARIFQMRPIAG